MDFKFGAFVHNFFLKFAKFQKFVTVIKLAEMSSKKKFLTIKPTYTSF